MRKAEEETEKTEKAERKRTGEARGQVGYNLSKTLESSMQQHCEGYLSRGRPRQSNVIGWGMIYVG